MNKKLFKNQDFHERNKLNAFIVSLVVPVFNESQAIPIFLNRIHTVFQTSPHIKLDIIFINDGSSDDTLSILLKHQETNSSIRIVDLSRNFGKEAAMSAGLKAVKGDVAVPIDVDLQDPPEIIIEMIQKWKEGYDVVLGKRSNRNSDTFLKRNSAKWFYRIHNKIADHEIPENVGDFRLMDRMVVNTINEFPESQRFMKGLFSWVGFKTTTVTYIRPERSAGTSKFNGWKLWNFALEGLTGFSTFPLRIWTYLGSIIAFTALLYACFIIGKVLILGIDVPGYASIMVSMMLLGGFQLIGIGVLGEYLGRTYMESKRRPIYVIRSIYENNDLSY